MAYVNVPKDLTKVKTKVLFNLTKRQLICAGYKAEAGLRLPVQHLPPAKPAQFQPAARRLLPLSLSSV